jgi:hypothetical protein
MSEHAHYTLTVLVSHNALRRFYNDIADSKFILTCWTLSDRFSPSKPHYFFDKNGKNQKEDN